MPQELEKEKLAIWVVVCHRLLGKFSSNLKIIILLSCHPPSLFPLLTEFIRSPHRCQAEEKQWTMAQPVYQSGWHSQSQCMAEPITMDDMISALETNSSCMKKDSAHPNPPVPRWLGIDETSKPIPIVTLPPTRPLQQSCIQWQHIQTRGQTLL